MDKFLGFAGGCDELGVLNGFRDLCEKYIEGLVELGVWFSCCHRVSDYQMDVMAIKGANGEKLGSKISEKFKESPYRSGIYKYFLINFLCYVEIPIKKFNKEIAIDVNSYDKFLATGCPEVMEYWANISESEVAEKYGAKIYALSLDDGDDIVPYVKLSTDKYGNKKLVNCRKGLDLMEKGIRVIPVFMLKAGVDTLYKKLQEGVVGIDFIKDSGDKRRLYSTLSFKEMNKVYDDLSFVENTIRDSYDGNFMGLKYLSRGIMRLPEVGGSRYSSISRYVNYARIVSLDYESEPDLTYVNIDVGSVGDYWNHYVLGMSDKSIADTWNALLEMGTMEESFSKRNIVGKSTLLNWYEVMHTTVGTVFDRELCLFMLANPILFQGYTGEPAENMGISSQVASSGSVGLL